MPGVSGTAAQTLPKALPDPCKSISAQQSKYLPERSLDTHAAEQVVSLPLN